MANPSDFKILIACEESQAVCKAFRERGFEAYSCDIIECSGGHPEWHICGDALPLLNGNCGFTTMDGVKHRIDGKWDLIIAHPPCTYLSKASARWMYQNGKLNNIRYEKAMRGKEFFMEFYNADCKRICIENPTPLKCVELPKPSQVIQPYLYDARGEHPYSKRTLLWLKGLPNLIPTTPNNIPAGTWCPSNTSNHSKGGGGGNGIAQKSKHRSKTFPGIAEAMLQWGDELLRKE